MANVHPAWLLKTRLRASVVAAVTASVFVRDIFDEFYRPHTELRWLLPPAGTHHGWPLIASNFAIYAYLWWVILWFVRRSHPLERLFVVGWAISILLWPLGWLRPQWTLPRFAGFVGITAALLTAISVLAKPTILNSVEPKGDVT